VGSLRLHLAISVADGRAGIAGGKIVQFSCNSQRSFLFGRVRNNSSAGAFAEFDLLTAQQGFTKHHTQLSATRQALKEPNSIFSETGQAAETHNKQQSESMKTYSHPSTISVAARPSTKSRVRLAAILACLAAVSPVWTIQAEPKVNSSPSAPTHQGGGKVLPPRAQPHGYSLDEMASAVANFSITGNNPAYYPDTPFQIIYLTADNTFTVSRGTYLYVKFFFIDDAEPVIGDWPARKRDADEYIFGETQLGGHDLEVEVDGEIFSLDRPGYVGGPVATPDSPDGSEHLIQIGAFVSPLKKGTHTLTIRGVFDGVALVQAIGGPYEFEVNYTIIVE